MNTRECPVCDEIFDECYHEGDFTVRFTGDHFSTTTVVWATSHDQAERLAEDLLANEYGWDMTELSNEVSIVLEGVANA